MRETFALIFATLALSISTVGLAMQIGIIKIAEQSKVSKFEKYRTPEGLLGRKRGD